jgi:hypothetical protein
MSSLQGAGHDPKNCIYSAKWALEVLGRYQDAHPRAAEFLFESLQISPKQLSNYIRYNDPLWTPLREGGKLAEQYMRYRGYAGQFFSQLEIEDRYTIVKYFYEYLQEKNAQRVVKRLDRLWYDTHNLMRSDSRGGESTSEQGDDDASSSPLDPPAEA